MHFVMDFTAAGEFERTVDEAQLSFAYDVTNNEF